MDSRQFSCAIAHSAASEFVRLGIPVPDREVVSTAIVEDAGVRVMISITRYDGPARLYPTPEGAAALGVPMTPVPSLTATQRKVLDVLDVSTPRKGTWIAAKLGIPYNGNLRSDLSKLVKAGLVKKDRGYVKNVSKTL